MDIALDGMWLSKLPTGGRVSVTELEGWWDSPEPNLLDDGEPDPADPWLPRIVSIAGNVHASSHDELHEAGEFLTGLLRKRGLLTVTGHGPTMSAEVTRSARVRFTTITDRIGLLSATLRAKDALKYGGWQDPVPMDQATPVQVFHRGNTDSYPVFRLTGNAPNGYTVAHEATGRTVEVRSPLPAGGVHVVDMATGRAYQDGVPVSEYGIVQPFTIEPGLPQSVRLRIRGSGTVQGTVQVQDVWV